MAISLAVTLALVSFAAGPRAAILAAQDCPQRTQTTRGVVVYGEPPRYSTGGGWQLGDRHDSLAGGTSIAICERRMVGFVVGRKLWLAVSYTREGGVRRGWIFGEGTTSLTRVAAAAGALDFLLPARAQAQDGLPGGGGGAVPAAWLAPVMMFLALILGMVAKGVFDWIQDGAPNDPRRYLLRTATAFIVSPMVFLTINNAGNFHFDGLQALLVYLALAFQSGFFWQTVFTGKPVPAPALVAARDR